MDDCALACLMERRELADLQPAHAFHARPDCSAHKYQALKIWTHCPRTQRRSNISHSTKTCSHLINPRHEAWTAWAMLRPSIQSAHREEQTFDRPPRSMLLSMNLQTTLTTRPFCTIISRLPRAPSKQGAVKPCAALAHMMLHMRKPHMILLLDRALNANRRPSFIKAAKQHRCMQMSNSCNHPADPK